PVIDNIDNNSASSPVLAFPPYLPIPLSTMSDAALPDSVLPEAHHPLGEAPPGSAGRSSASGLNQPAPISDELKARLDTIIHSEIGITTLLARLKQSVASAKVRLLDFPKEESGARRGTCSGAEETGPHSPGCRGRTDNRQGTYSASYKEIQRIHERMADHGLQFAVSLQQMSDDLQELSTNMERGRKQWKQTGLAAEKRVNEAESQAEKAKAKYDTLAEQYDRVRTGDKTGGKFGLKGHKSAAQHEEELLRKVQNADSDYQSKVEAAQMARRELVNTHRPQAVYNLQQLISECDSGLTLQQQKFATFNEKLLLSQGLCVSPIKADANGIGPKSLAEVVRQVDNEKDLRDFILSHAGNPGAVAGPEVQYERHPTLGGGGASTGSQPQAKRQSSMVFQQPNMSSPSQPASSTFQASSYSVQNELPAQGPPPTGSPQPPFPSAHEAPPVAPPPTTGPPSNLPPLKPVFGVSLEDLYARDGTAVPFIVYQCFQAIELFGVAGLVKQFFRDLPDPLFTNQYYSQFIEAARIEDDIQRRDSMHALINNLPDAHYATLRAIILHLHKVQEHYTQNRMNAGNLAICFGPTLMGANTGGNIADAGWQVRVIETILNNTFQIFDDD
ncbi:hypothetical protein N7470_004923, partial [Penicillium chermesinum]